MKTEEPQAGSIEPADLKPAPTPLSQLPTPKLGQNWGLAALQAEAEAAWDEVQAGRACYDSVLASDTWFKVLIGNWPVPPGADIPALQDLGLYFWYIPPWADDDQLPHKEDEAYFVIDGKGLLCVEGRTQEVNKGDLVFVPRCAAHKFFTPFEQALTLLIIFTPPYTSAHPAAQPDTCCDDDEYAEKSRRHLAALRQRYQEVTGKPCPPKDRA